MALKLLNNYIYFYHLQEWCILPTFPESITDSSSNVYASTDILGRSAPIFTYSYSGPRSITFSFKLHRDMLNSIDIEASNFNLNGNEDLIDKLIKYIQASAVPRYSSDIKAVNPPLVSIRLGNDIYIKGIINGAVNVTYSGPLSLDDKYLVVDINFSVTEIDPYDADSVKLIGSFRGLDMQIEEEIYK